MRRIDDGVDPLGVGDAHGRGRDLLPGQARPTAARFGPGPQVERRRGGRPAARAGAACSGRLGPDLGRLHLGLARRSSRWRRRPTSWRSASASAERSCVASGATDFPCHVVQCTAKVRRTMYDQLVHHTPTAGPTRAAPCARGRTSSATAVAAGVGSGRGPAGRRRRAARQALRRPVGAAGPRPPRRAGHRARPARPQRRRQDHGHPHPDHPVGTDRGPGLGGRLRRRPPARRRPPPHRRGRPAGHGRRPPRAPGSTSRWSGACTTSRRPRPAAGPTSCSSASTSPTPPTGWSRPSRAACAAGSTWPPASSPRPRCCSSTSPRPGSTPAAAATSGTSSGPGPRRHDRHPHHPVPGGGRPPGRRHRRARPRSHRRPWHARTSSRPASATTASTSASPTVADLAPAAAVLARVRRRPTPTFDPEPRHRRRSSRRGLRLIDVIRALDAAGIDAVDVNRRQATLDDVFLTLTSPSAGDHAARRSDRRPTTDRDRPERRRRRGPRMTTAAPRPRRRAPSALAGDHDDRASWLAAVERLAGLRPPQHRAHPPDPREAARRHDPAADVRAAVRLRVRRRDRGQRRQLPRVHHRRHPRAVAGLRHDRARPRRSPPT